MTEKYTPGPWFTTPYAIDPNRWIVTSKSPDPRDGEIICLTPQLAWVYTDKEVAQYKANAVLIASAPDLLAERDALRKGLEEITKMEPGYTEGDAFTNSYDCATCQAMQEFACAALAAAEES